MSNIRHALVCIGNKFLFSFVLQIQQEEDFWEKKYEYDVFDNGSDKICWKSVCLYYYVADIMYSWQQTIPSQVRWQIMDIWHPYYYVSFRQVDAINWPWKDMNTFSIFLVECIYCVLMLWL